MRQESFWDYKIISIKEAYDKKDALEKEGWEFVCSIPATNKIKYRKKNEKYFIKQKYYKEKHKWGFSKKEPENKKKEPKKKEEKKIEWWKDNFKDI